MRCLLLTPQFPWPLHGGRQINTHHTAAELIRHGHEVWLGVKERPTSDQLAAWPLTRQVKIRHLEPAKQPQTNDTLNITQHKNSPAHPLITSNIPAENNRSLRSKLQARLASYFGVDPAMAQTVAETARQIRAQYVEGCGLEVLPWMTQLQNVVRVWAEADEKFWFHCTLLRDCAGLKSKIECLKQGLIMGAYERAFASFLDAIVTVAPMDQKMMRWISGVDQTLLCPNGVDSYHYHPIDKTKNTFEETATNQFPQSNTVVFWGRLDFLPNVRAVEWFADKVWKTLSAQHPHAKWYVIGRGPTPELKRKLQSTPGIELVADTADIRPWIWRSQVVVLPLWSGSGIKNKMLEAAAMGKAIVASPRAAAGLRWDAGTCPPWKSARSSSTWIREIQRLWNDAQTLQNMGHAARQWVTQYHDWTQAALIREQLFARLTNQPIGRIDRTQTWSHEVAA